jgi:hypothetical protein
MNRWNEAGRGNAHVSDGCIGYWSEFQEGTTAQMVLDDFMSTADYSGATGTFVVEAEIDGQLASVCVGPGGEVQSCATISGVDADGDCVLCGHPANNSSGHGTCSARCHQ